jgi:two-component system nitrate/nitrite response regulator NarL
MDRSEPSAAGDQISVVVADDDRRVRSAVTTLLDSHPRFSVVGAAATGEEAARLCVEHTPALAIVDVTMPTGGETAIRAIRAGSATTVVVVHTARSDRHTIDRMLAAGAIGVITKGAGGSFLQTLTGLWDQGATGDADPTR